MEGTTQAQDVLESSDNKDKVPSRTEYSEYSANRMDTEIMVWAEVKV